jgi:hypothetical protein
MARTTSGKPALLSGGNPQIPKGDGDAPVQAYIAALPGWKSEVGRRLDALITAAVPGVRKAVRWNSPLYGVEGHGWFLGVHAYTRYVKLTFFKGAARRPPASPRAPTCATSTSTKTTTSTRSASPPGLNRPPPCRVGAGGSGRRRTSSESRSAEL